MTAAILPFLGVVIGAILQYLFTRHLDGQRAHRDARTKAYADYLKCVSDRANPAQDESTDEHEVNARTADAKCRICLYGSSATVAAFAKFERLGATMRTVQERNAFTDMVVFMRADSLGTSDALPSDVQAVLLGNDNGTGRS